MFSLEREKIIAWYEKCIPGFVKHKIDVFMKNSVGVLGGMVLALILGMFVINLYRLGVFDRKIAFFKRRFEMLTTNSEEEEKENKKE